MIRANLKQENIIVVMASMDICPLGCTYFYVNGRTKFKCKNVSFGMVTHFKNNSKQAGSVSTFLLNNRWNYCTQSPQMFHALTQDIDII